MENDFFAEMNKNIVDTIKNGPPFFMSPIQTQLPTISNSFGGLPITGANYFNLMLSNAANGTNHTEFVKTNEVLSTKPEWLSTLPRENRPKGILCQEESPSGRPRFSFMMPTAELNQNTHQDNQENTAQRANYVPFQTNNANKSDFGAFIQEQCTNAVNASLTNCPFMSSVPEHEMMQYTSMLVNEIVKNPEFVANLANKAFQEVTNQHYLPFDRKGFIDNARDTDSNEFKQLNSAITDHVDDMRQNKKGSFNHEFTELARPLMDKIENLTQGNVAQGKVPQDLTPQNNTPQGNAPQEQKADIGGMVTDFIKDKIQEAKPAEVLADTFAGTFVEKAQKLANVGQKVFAGVALVSSIASPIMSKNFEAQDIVNIANNLTKLQGLMGNKDLKTHMDNNDTRSFHTCLDKTLRDNPQMLDQAISQLDKTNKQENTQSASRGR